MNYKSIKEMAELFEGIPVIGVMSESPSERIGIKVGDIIIKVNGHRTKTSDDYTKIIENKEEPRDFVVMRDGEEIFLSVDNPIKGKN